MPKMVKQMLIARISLLILVYSVSSGGFHSWAELPSSDLLTFGSKRILDHRGKLTSGPAAQVDHHGKTHISWIQSEAGNLALHYLQSSWDSDSFPQSVQVNPPAQPAASLHEPPALAVGPDQSIQILWTTPHPQANGKLFTSILNLSHSEDGGQTFSAPVRVNDDNIVTGHSFENLAIGQDGTIHMAWLDAREGKKDPSTYTSRSVDGGRSVTPNLKLDDHTCVCCRTSVATGQNGMTYIAWRKIFPGEVRETVLAHSSDGGNTYSQPVIVGDDQWIFNGCPHRPASLGVDAHDRVYVTWYTEGPDDTPGVYFAISDDHGKTFSPRRQLNTTKGVFPDHPQMAVDAKGRLMVIWEEQSPVRREVVLRYSLDRGQTFNQTQKLNVKKSHHPAVAMNDMGQGILAWQEQIKFPHWSTVLQPVFLKSESTPPSVAHNP